MYFEGSFEDITEKKSSENTIRKQLIEENLLSAVIGLPANLFFGTGIPAAILIFDKDKTTDDVDKLSGAEHDGDEEDDSDDETYVPPATGEGTAGKKRKADQDIDDSPNKKTKETE